MNIRLVKKIDAGIGKIAASVMPQPVRTALPSAITSMLLIRPGGIGDAALLTPAIRVLYSTFPALQITVLAERRNAGIFGLVPGVSRVLCYDRPGELFQALRARYDVVIDTEQWHRLSAVVARLAAAPLKVGFDTNERRRMFTDAVPYSHDDYEAFSFGHLLRPLGIEPEKVDAAPPCLSVPSAASAKAALLLEALHDQSFVTIFPGASIPERCWGAGRFRRVAEMLFAVGMKTVIVGGAGDRHQGEEIAAGAGLNLTGLTSLPETAAVIQRSSLLLSGDSGVLHIAVGLGIPTVSLFGPGRALKWAPRGDCHTVINKGLACSPCTTYGTTPPCPFGVRCMRDISVDEVFKALCMRLGQL